MGNRVTVMSGYDTPITENSERSMFAIEAKNEKELAKTLEKWMKKRAGRQAPRDRRIRHLGTHAERQRGRRADDRSARVYARSARAAKRRPAPRRSEASG